MLQEQSAAAIPLQLFNWALGQATIGIRRTPYSKCETLTKSSNCRLISWKVQGSGTDLKSNHGAGWEVISSAGSLIETSGLVDGANQTIGEEDTHPVRVS